MTLTAHDVAQRLLRAGFDDLSELEILDLHRKLDALREEQWRELIDLQHRQIELLTGAATGEEPSAGGTAGSRRAD